MRIIVSGGGTGGHIYPALTLIRTIQKQLPDTEFLYVGTNEGLEADIIPKEGLPFAAVDIKGFERRLTTENILRAGKAMSGVIKAMGLVRSFRPDVAVGTGGYVCGPILLAASLLGVPTLIQEQNVVAGITNRILSRFVSRIAVGTREAIFHFPASKTVFTGNPIRDEVMSAGREAGIREFGLDPAKKTVLISGGSRGARSINKAMTGVLKHYAGSRTVQLLHVTGQANYEAAIEALKTEGIKPDGFDNIFVKPYLYNMPLAMAAADLVVFRAGATGLAELTARGIPAIIIPYPYATENHQELNARALAREGAAEMILDKELTAQSLLLVMEKLLGDDEGLKKMSLASRKLGKPQAAGEIASMIIALAQGKGKF